MKFVNRLLIHPTGTEAFKSVSIMFYASAETFIGWLKLIYLSFRNLLTDVRSFGCQTQLSVAKCRKRLIFISESVLSVIM